MSSSPQRVAVLGGAGAGAGELLRLLLAHPGVTVTRVVDRQHPGTPVHALHPRLFQLSDLVFTDEPPAEAAKGVDLVFGTYRGASHDLLRLPESTRVLDLSGESHRHGAAAEGAKYVYGLPEFNRRQIAGATRVANPGSLATAVLLTLLPLAQAGCLEGQVTIFGLEGSSESVHAMRPLGHEQLSEIEQALSNAGAPEARLTFIAHSGPVGRGVHATVVFRPKEILASETVHSVYHSHYHDERFVRLVTQPPDTSVVAGTNFADLLCHSDGRDIVVLVALDSLIKGMAGQAIQSMNLMLGLPEGMGLGPTGMRD